MRRTLHDEDELFPHRGGGETLFRLVRSSQTSEDDWRSHYEQGKHPRKAEIASALDHMGLSMWDDPRRLQRLFELYPQLGGFIAELSVRGDLGLWLAATGPEGHYSVWGRPADMQRCVAAIHRLVE